jgi:integrase
MNLLPAIEAFDFSLSSGNYSDQTRAVYQWALRLLAAHLGDVRISETKPADLDRFWSYIRHDYVPTRMNGKTDPLAGRSLENIWTAERSFFGWLLKTGKIKKRPDLNIAQPAYSERVIQPFTAEEVVKLIKAAARTKPAETTRRKTFTMPRQTAKRDTAIIMLLADTGMRVSECARLNWGDFDLRNGTVTIRAFGTGRKTKEHSQLISRSTRLAIHEYKIWREERENLSIMPYDLLFVTLKGNPMNKDSIRGVLAEIGRSAGVLNAHPHRFRHFYMSTRAADGAGEYVLINELGLSTTKTARHYVNLERMKKVPKPMIMDRLTNLRSR